MTNTTRKISILLPMVYIGIIVVKDYLVNLLVYMNDSEKGLAYISLKSALIQAVILICGALAFIYIKYITMRKEAVYNGEEAQSFLEIGGFRKISLSEAGAAVLIGTLSYIAFNSLKNVYMMFKFCVYGDAGFAAEKIPVGSGEFLFLLFIFAFLMVIGEELVYRSMLFYNLYCKGKKNVFSILFCILVFAAAHGSVEQMLQAAFLALLLCTITIKSQSVFICVIIHMIYNVLGTTITYYNPMFMLEFFGAGYDMLQVDGMIVAVKLLLAAVIATTLLFLLVQSRGIRKISVSELAVKKNLTGKEGILLGVILIYSIYKIYKVLQ
ncbi:MAG: CPBP family intramembrane metalloprotease [Lachnospiraceae bacterium]|nr:CPBP family intramembrane metalloprotease [Lachnospiraceae bacterium]